MKITLEDVFVKYWSQILLIVTGVGIFLRMFLNYSLKKKEIRHEIFQNQRMNALVRFYNSYAELKSMWVKLPIWNIFQNELTSEAIDKIIQPPLNKLQASIIELQIFFDSNLFKKLKSIESNMLRINSEFLEIAFSSSPEKTRAEKANAYYSIRTEVESENSTLLEEISKEIAKSIK